MEPNDLKQWAARNAAQGMDGDFGGGGGFAGAAGGEVAGEEPAAEPVAEVTSAAMMSLAEEARALAEKVTSMVKATTESEVDIAKLSDHAESLTTLAEDADGLADELLDEEEVAAKEAEEAADEAAENADDDDDSGGGGFPGA